ncbi:MAG TPA: GAP family protein [Acidimicrobiales bacterium]|nr:GAP family protein [Acidimicrobiales bacterium]
MCRGARSRSAPCCCSWRGGFGATARRTAKWRRCRSGWPTSTRSRRSSPAGLGVVPAAVNPKNLILTMGSAAGRAQLGLTTSDAIVATVIFVVIASLTIAGPVLYATFGGARAKTSSLGSAKGWLGEHNAAVMAVLFLVFGVDLIAKGLPPLR